MLRESPVARAGRLSRLDPLANRNLLAASVLADELVRCGIRDVCMSPGARAAPLVLAAVANARLDVHVHVDERCAGFYALGLARAARRPVALLCTSGSAAAHFHPAVIEAFETGVPLVLLTADRPPELLDCGAPQTTEQRGLFGPHVRGFTSIGLPKPEAGWLRWLRSRICRMVEIAEGPPAGPVHLDIHFDEPLSPVRIEGDVPADLADVDPIAVGGRPDGAPYAPWAAAELRPPGAALDEMATLVRARPRGVIVVGPLDANAEERTAIAFLARAAGVPVLADPLSGLRRPAPDGVQVIGAYDAFFRSEAVLQGLRPEWILRLGRTPTSKHLVRWMGMHRDARQIVVDEQGRREDPNHVGALFVRARTAATCGVLGTAVRGGEVDAERQAWADRWRTVERATSTALSAGAASGPDHFEGGLVERIGELLPPDATLLAASSMPVRELDAFLTPAPRRLRVIANRGVNGIDGLVSTAFGIDAGTAGPMVALLGDLATLHDLGGLAAVPRLGRTGTIIVVNNGGGGIFHYLPMAETDAPTSELFSTEHDLGFRHAAAMFGLEYRAPATAAELAEILAECDDDRARLVELVVDRADSVAHHKAIWRAAASAAEAALATPASE